MRLVHYSAYPVTQLMPIDWPQPEHTYKPLGFWVSIEGDKDSYGWRRWCEDGEWNLDGLRFEHSVRLTKDANILWLTTPKEIWDFNEKYSRKLTDNPISDLRTVDWQRLATEYDGLFIAPYQWGLRLELSLLWYNGWDCASGVVWNTTKIKEVRLSRERKKYADVPPREGWADTEDKTLAAIRKFATLMKIDVPEPIKLKEQ